MPLARLSRQAWRQAPGLLFEALSAVGGLLIVMLMCFIGADILGRTFLNRPVRGVAEIASLTIVAIVFLQLPQAVRGRRMLRSDSLLLSLGSRRPRIAHALDAVNALALGSMLAIILYFGVQPFLQSWRIGEYLGALGDFTAPLWPMRLMMLIGCLFAALYCTAMLVQSLRAMFGARDTRNVMKDDRA